MKRFVIPLAAFAILVSTIIVGGVGRGPTSVALAQSSPTPFVSACLNGTAVRPCQAGDVAACIDTNTVVPCSSPTPTATPTGGAFSGYAIHFTRGDGVLRIYEVAFTLPASGRTMQVAGAIHFSNGAPDIVLQSGGTSPATVTFPTFPIAGSPAWVGVQIDQNTGATTLLIGTTQTQVLTAAGTVHTLWTAELLVGAANAAAATNQQFITPQ